MAIKITQNKKESKKDAFVINLISGKGGTGKTLFAAVLANELGSSGLSVLVIDLDIFVRGLTTLLYFDNDKPLIVSKSRDSIYDYLQSPNLKESLRNLGILRYRSFDVLPSVSTIDEILSFRDEKVFSFPTASTKIKRLLSVLIKDYDVIILDSRAGYDDFVLASCMVSDAILCIQEDDDVSRITADNLIRQIQEKGGLNVFRVTNKARGIDTREKLKEERLQGIRDLGRIPFDFDVLKSFGTEKFWFVISKSLYMSGLVQVWNRFGTLLGLDFILRENRVNPVAMDSIEKSLSIFGSRERLLVFYGFLIMTISIIWLLYDDILKRLFEIDPLRFVAIITSVLGMLISVYGIFSSAQKK